MRLLRIVSEVWRMWPSQGSQQTNKRAWHISFSSNCLTFRKESFPVEKNKVVHSYSEAFIWSYHGTSVENLMINQFNWIIQYNIIIIIYILFNYIIIYIVINLIENTECWSKISLSTKITNTCFTYFKQMTKTHNKIVNTENIKNLI